MKVLSRPVVSCDALQKLCAEIAGMPYLAVDTEFTRFQTYRPVLELIQVATDEIVFCIDAARISNWSGLREIFNAPSTTVVLHAADQDLEVLELHQLVPARMVDSQIAAQLCGSERLSYQHLVGQHLGISLAKDQTRSDWSRRPLTSQQIRYALNDVRYLLSLYRHFEHQLCHLDRMAWLEEECSRLRELPRGDRTVATAWQSFGAGATLTVSDQHIAKALLSWREARASLINWPRQWVLSDKQILELIAKRPASERQTANLLGLKCKQTLPNWVSSVHKILISQSANGVTPLWHSKKRLSLGEKKKVDHLLQHIRLLADQHAISASLLCTRQEAVELARGKRTARILSGWRKTIAESLVGSLLGGADKI